MKKYLFIALLAMFFLVGCGKKVIIMDQPSEDGNYHYQNFGLGFSLVLPPEFIYYQTQKIESTNFIDIEFFVPTSDVEHDSEVEGYARSLIVRLTKNQEGDNGNWGKDGSSFRLIFWENIPVDWTDKWNNTMAEAIIDSFKVE